MNQICHKVEKGDGYITKAKGFKFRRWTRTEKAKVGAILIELFRDSTGLIMIFNVRESKKKTVRYISATEKTFEWIDNFHKDSELLEPYWLPMVEQPKDWVSTSGGGGYQIDEIPIYPIVKQRDWTYRHRILPEADIPEILEALNLLQKTAYKVNQKVLTVFEHFWDIGYEFAGLPGQELVPWP
ncbi:MAG: hypothetical protein IH969_09400, partial [Candidatus Krumholzibacteriota bacterium]|nr:hypothetical protein [Candidatus Krumholzibacteriota bacterium]